jgi:peptidase E
MARDQRIIAMGGGGFSMEPENRLLDDYVLSFARRPKPRVCFVPTAANDDPGYVVRFFDAFPASRAEASWLPLFKRRDADLRKKLLEQDVIYVGGGNTANLLAIWQTHGLYEILREAWVEGIVLCGVSAGAMCWFEAGVTDSFGPALDRLDEGMGFLPGSFCPHYDGEKQRRPTFRRLVSEGLPDGWAADDGCALHFVGKALFEAVSSRPSAQAFYVERSGDASEETIRPARFLGKLEPVRE